MFDPSEAIRVCAGPPQTPCPPDATAQSVAGGGDGSPCGASHGALTVLALISVLAIGAGVARADEDKEASSGEDTAAPATAAENAAAAVTSETTETTETTGDAAPDPDAFDLSATIDDMIAGAHGSISAEYRLRSGDDDTDQDIYSWLDLRLGDENRDRISATFYARSTWDLDGQRKNRERYEFTSIADTYDSSYNVRLYSAYLTFRPNNSPVEMARVGRQYVYAAETFHVDGLYAESAVLEEGTRLTASVYGGVPVHLYESSPSGDWIAGTSVSVEPLRGTRATLDYVHVTDDFEGTARDDTTALRVWQRATPWLNLYGRATYLHGLRDAEARATASFDEQDLMVQVSWFTLLEDKDEEFTTEFDPYRAVLHTLSEYDQYKLRAVKGFGDDVVVEVGADVRDADTEGTFNRDVQRYYVTPSFVDALWDDSEISVVAERWSGNGQRIETYGGELTQTFSDKIEASIGSDYTMYGYDGFRDRERNHVRSVFAELRWDLTETLALRVRHVHEEDDEETYDVFTLGLTLAF